MSIFSDLFGGDIKPTPNPIKKIIIDCDVGPFIPPDLELYEHRKMGKVSFDINRLRLEQFCWIGCPPADGFNLKDLYYQISSNANILEYVWGNRSVIENLDEWCSKKIFFFGTIYRYRNGKLCVPYIQRQWWNHENCWVRGTETLDYEEFDERCLIACGFF